MQSELIDLPKMVAQLKELGDKDHNGLPAYVRFCEGTDPKEGNKTFNKRVFIGDKALWLDINITNDDIKAILEKELGYLSYGNTHVPDGWGKNYDSIYYRQPTARAL